MSTRAEPSQETFNPYRDFDFEFEDAFVGDVAIDDELTLGDRICAPSSGVRGSTMLPAAIAILVLSASGFALLKTRATWEGWVSTTRATVSSSLQPGETGPADPLAAAAETPAGIAPPPSSQQIETRDIADAPGTDAGTPAPPVTTAAVSPETEADSAASSTVVERLPPPSVDSADKFQTRAMANGLHPGLSPGLLSRMSAADFRNAGIAIKTALADTPDSGVFAWPRDPQPKRASFEVRFVQGAPGDCRRYVVTVTKDRWSTTAQPMEKCGVRPPAQKLTPPPSPASR